METLEPPNSGLKMTTISFFLVVLTLCILLIEHRDILSGRSFAPANIQGAIGMIGGSNDHGCSPISIGIAWYSHIAPYKCAHVPAS